MVEQSPAALLILQHVTPVEPGANLLPNHRVSVTAGRYRLERFQTTAGSVTILLPESRAWRRALKPTQSGR